ncbi:LysR family transcriptional regulator [Caballeronia catudaia]|uniref:LysR family transcriptional regulator n=1 Tax=Caballeronia catudaia TaxID=1777136 RepID=A0A158CHP9_9BURK|nr:LysR family transcriptional regulator [Caballeronia catudaia]SAK81845.1 LysR family transcriptional regulator [Caballeronia catudaia]
MDTLSSMRMFSRVAEEGSFTAAAQRMNTSTAATSRAIASLEAHLKARLLHRSTRRVILTEAGRRYLQRCEQILACVDQAEAEAADARLRPAGHLRIHASTSLGQSYVVPAIVHYQEQHPTVSIDLTLSQHTPDIIDEGYDLTVQATIADLPDSSLVAQRLGTVHSVLCASPRYLNEHGTPRTLEELSRHRCYQLVSTIFPRDSWRFEGPNGIETFPLPKADFGVNVAGALAVALCEGMGIGALPMSTARAALTSGVLVRVLPEYRLQSLTLHALYPSRQYLNAKVKTFVEFIKDFFPSILESDAADLG